MHRHILNPDPFTSSLYWMRLTPNMSQVAILHPRCPSFSICFEWALQPRGAGAPLSLPPPDGNTTGLLWKRTHEISNIPLTVLINHHGPKFYHLGTHWPRFARSLATPTPLFITVCSGHKISILFVSNWYLPWLCQRSTDDRGHLTSSLRFQCVWHQSIWHSAPLEESDPALTHLCFFSRTDF